MKSFTTKEAAEILGIKPNALHYYNRKKVLKQVPSIGREAKYSHSSVMKLKTYFDKKRQLEKELML